MIKIVTINEYQKLHPEQWVNVYGIIFNRCEYINTCQVYQVETLLNPKLRSWFEDLLLEPVDELEQPMSVEEAMQSKLSNKTKTFS